MFRFVRFVLFFWALVSPWQGAAADAGGDAEARLALLGRLVRDDSAAVRLEALRALAKIPSARAAELALGVLEKPMDPALDYALWLTINELAEPWIAAVQSGVWKPEGREAQLAFALRALKGGQVARVLGTVLGDRPLPRDGSGPWIEVIGTAGSPADLGRLMRQVGAGEFEPAAVVRALKALGEAARLRQVKPDGDRGVVARFLGPGDAALRAETIRLAGWWKEEAFVDPLVAVVSANPPPPAAERALVFEALRQIGGAKGTASLAALATRAEGEPGVRRGASVALAALDAVAGFRAVVAVAPALADEAAALEFWRAVLAIKGSGAPLREALEGRKLPEAVARAGVRVAREGGRADLELVAAMAVAGGLVTDAGQLTGEAVKEMAVRAVAQGDPARGEWVYRRTDLACMTCHAIGGAGGKVGPDLTSIGASAPTDYLVESLLLPSAKIKEGYAAVVVETRNGEEVTGTLARENQEELFLRNAAGQEVAVAKRVIARRETGRLSLMPGGLLEALGEQERLDLVAFLGRLGKPGAFDASRGGVARRWRLANVVHTDLQNNQEDWYWKRPLDDPRFVSVDALAGGDLTRGLLDEALKAQAWTSKVAVVAVSELDQPAAGRLTFRLGTAEAELWIGGRRVGSGPEVEVEVPAGRQRVVVRLDPRRIPETVRLEGEGAVFGLN